MRNRKEASDASHDQDLHAGERWMARFPAAETAPQDMADADGKISEDMLRAYFRQGDGEFVTMSSRDDKGVLCAAYEFCWQLSCCIRHMEESGEHDCRTHAESNIDRSLERKMRRDRISYCRMDFDRIGGAVRVRISCANPKDVVGPALRSARTFAVDAVRIMAHIADEISRNTDGQARIVVEERDDEESRGIVDEAREKDLRQVREECARRCSGHCSPIKPDCPFYRMGRCEEDHVRNI